MLEKAQHMSVVMPMKKKVIVFFTLAAAGLAARLLFLYPPAVTDGDAACFGLMAMDIYHLKEFPIYLRLAHYNGVLVSYIGAGLFALFGVSSLVYNISGILFSSLWVWSGWLLARKILDEGGILVVCVFLALPPVYLLYLSIYPGGIYAETLLFGVLLLLLLVKYINNEFKHPVAPFCLLGFLAGFGLWVTPHIAPFILTILTVFLMKERQWSWAKHGYFILAFLAGYAPALAYNLMYPGASFMRMAGRVLNLNRSILGSPDKGAILLKAIAWRISTVPESLLRAPYSTFLLIGLSNLLLFVAGVVVLMRTQVKKLTPLTMLLILACWSVVFYVFLVGERSPRYMITVCLLAPYFIGYLAGQVKLRSRLIYYFLVGVVLLYNVYTISRLLYDRLHNHYMCSITYNLEDKRSNHYPQLAEWLSKRGFVYGFSDYWTAYPVVFESKQKILISATLFHPAYGDRWPEQTAIVRNGRNQVIILDVNLYPEKTAILEKRLKNLGVSYTKELCYEFAVYHGFSPQVYPEDLQWLSENG
jgi:hypothetical protein